MNQSDVEIYPQKAESLVHIHISTGGAIVAQATAVRVIVVIIHVYAVLPGTEPFIVRPVRVATAIKCHFHSGDCFGSASRSHTDKNSFTLHLILIEFNWYMLDYYLRNWMHPLYVHFLIAF